MAADPGGKTEKEAEGMKDTFRLCRKCGKPVAVIERGLYRKILVDAEAVLVATDSLGADYMRIDGSKVKGLEVAYDSNVQAEPAYRPHRCGR